MSTPNPQKRQKNRKVLLMGKSGAGKSSMRSIVFSNYVAKDVRRLGATIDVEHSNVRFLGNLSLDLWDCGGQDGFMENYLTHQRSQIFSGVAVLIFVFDIESREFAVDLVNYGNVMRALGEFSPSAKVFVLVHKMDLVQVQLRVKTFEERSNHINDASESFKENVEFYATSIWDQSLYKAWTQVIYHLTPNASHIKALLIKLANVIQARELVLYERATCLMVTYVTRDPEESKNPLSDRFERISSILKTHKQSVTKHLSTRASTTTFSEMQVKTSRFMFFITRLTENTNLAASIPPSEQVFNAARLNIMLARPLFLELDLPRGPGRAAHSSSSGGGTPGVAADGSGSSGGHGGGGGGGGGGTFAGGGGGFVERAARDLSSGERATTRWEEPVVREDDGAASAGAVNTG